MSNKKLESYLESIQNIKEGLDSEIKKNIIIATAKPLIIILLTLLIYISMYKKNDELTKRINKITKKNYTVRIVPIESPNAFCFGGFGKSIFVTKGLLKLCNEREVDAVMLHETGHIVNLDSITSSIMEIGLLAGFWGLIIPAIIKFIKKPEKMSLKTFAIMHAILALFLTILCIKVPSFFLGRLHEYNADKTAAKYGYGKDLISALEKLEDWVKKELEKRKNQNKFFGKINEFLYKFTRLIDVHPSTKNRINKLFEDIEIYEALAKRDKEKIRQIVYKYVLES